ncbi:AMP-binding protein [Nonomuraea sp. NPDC050536]|uniref:AMP-binding protein n=1 Tax=Nonomuraea sp. NPDC050536 TaxID=3364366 RepID=UPI0037C7FE92
MVTFAELVLARAEDDRVGLRFEDMAWSWREVVAEARLRAAEIPRGAHVGVLLDNVPEYLFWIFGAALAGGVVVGINPTRRGSELAADIRHTDCAFIVTDASQARLLDRLDLGVPVRLVDEGIADVPDRPRGADGVACRTDPLLLLFTSGSTGAPKAVVCSQGRLADIGAYGERFGIGPESVTYVAMPLFHGNSIMANVAMATCAGATITLRRRFSAGGFISDIRKYRVTYVNYVGRALAYILATPEAPDDGDNALRVAFGTEASARDMAEFARRFGCQVIEGYGSSEGAISLNRTPETPPDALGLPPEGMEVAVHDQETGRECPRAEFDETGALVNGDAAIGEIVGRNVRFEGYYNNPEADARRLRDGWYWSGDLGYRDQAGYFYFAGRDLDWLRVDSENFAAAPVERIIARHPKVVMVAVYAIPDPVTGDQVMAAIEGDLTPDELGNFLKRQDDLGTKWAPRYVRLVKEMPLTATNKVDKRGLRKEATATTDPLWHRPGKELRYVPL